MAEAQYAPNHTVDPETGFLENNGYPFAFDAPRKKLFIDTMVKNGLSVYNTCKALKLSHHTFFHHIKSDPAFKQAWEEAKELYGDKLAGISMMNAMKSRSVIERIFQLKWLYPERYADRRDFSGAIQVNFNIDGKVLDSLKNRTQVIDGEIVKNSESSDK